MVNHTKWKQNFQIGEHVYLNIFDFNTREEKKYLAVVKDYKQEGFFRKKQTDSPKRYKVKILNGDLENTIQYAFEYELEKIK